MENHAASGETGQITAVRDYIDGHFREDLTLEGLAARFFMSKTSLCQNFRRAFGTTVISLVNELRLNEAKRLLREDRLSVSRIASEVGFHSIYYFSKFFRLAEGVSPSVWRERHVSRDREAR